MPSPTCACVVENSITYREVMGLRWINATPDLIGGTFGSMAIAGFVSISLGVKEFLNAVETKIGDDAIPQPVQELKPSSSGAPGLLFRKTDRSAAGEVDIDVLLFQARVAIPLEQARQKKML